LHNDTTITLHLYTVTNNYLTVLTEMWYIHKTVANQNKKQSKEKKFLEFKQSKPIQLSLFELLEGKERDYSNTVELYDFMPKYVWGKVERIAGAYLPTLSREFECRGKRFKIEISPARIKTDESEIEYYPSKREEIVEDGLRKLLVEGHGTFLDGEVGITFTIYQLQKELADNGHTYSRDQIKQSLQVLAKTKIYLKSEDTEIEIIFSPIETLGFRGKEDEIQTFVRLSSLVTKSVKERSFRLFNYEKVMSYKSVIARQLHKRMSHHYTQASLTNPYSILLTTIIRDFGLTQQKQIRNNQIEVEKAIQEMKIKNTVINCKIEKVIETKPRVKLLDVKFIIQPHPNFVSEITEANIKKKNERFLTE
jgi:hypothetical protein